MLLATSKIVQTVSHRIGCHNVGKYMLKKQKIQCGQVVRHLSAIGKEPTFDSSIQRQLFEKEQQESWSWVPPRHSITKDQLTENDVIIPVIENTLLTSEEIKVALIAQGGENVSVIPVKGRLDTIKELVVVTGRSSRHLRKLGDSIVSALKARQLQQAPGITGIEGDKEDDWMLVDCYNIAVNLMLPKTRTALNIEDHWSREEKPTVDFTLDSKAYNARFEEMLEKYPIPEGYGDDTSDSDDNDSSYSNRQSSDSGHRWEDNDDDVIQPHPFHQPSTLSATADQDADHQVLKPEVMTSVLKFARNSNSNSNISSSNVDGSEPRRSGRVKRQLTLRKNNRD